MPFFLSSVTEVGAGAGGGGGERCRRCSSFMCGGTMRFVDDHVRRAIDAGYDAFCITVDSAIYSRRERDIANRFAKPWRARSAGMEFQAALSWDNIARFKDKHAIKLILKGIATAEDATPGVRAWASRGSTCPTMAGGSSTTAPGAIGGVAGGGRGGRRPGAGDRSMAGSAGARDVVKAMALGADLVGMGRLYCMGSRRPGRRGSRG